MSQIELNFFKRYNSSDDFDPNCVKNMTYDYEDFISGAISKLEELLKLDGLIKVESKSAIQESIQKLIGAYNTSHSLFHEKFYFSAWESELRARLLANSFQMDDVKRNYLLPMIQDDVATSQRSAKKMKKIINLLSQARSSVLEVCHVHGVHRAISYELVDVKQILEDTDVKYRRLVYEMSRISEMMHVFHSGVCAKAS